MLCSCRLDIPRAPLSHSSIRPCPVCTTGPLWLLLAITISPPGYPERASILDSLFDSFTRILCECASYHSRHGPGSRPRRRQPLWNDACHHALVARNGSWRDFRPHMRIKLVSASCPSSRTHNWNEWLGSVTSLSHRAPKLACSLVRTFRSSVVSPATCNGMVLPALPFLMRRVPNGAPIFPLTISSTHSLCASRLSRPCTILGDLMLPSQTTNSLLRFPSATSLLPVRTASLTLQSLSSATVTPSSLDSYRPISLASCAFKLFEHLIYARIAPHILPQTLPRAVSAGVPTLWPPRGLLGLRRHEHTFVAFMDIKKA